MTRKHNQNKLPILQRSHRPQVGPRICDERSHAELVKSNPAFFQQSDELPYGVFVMEDGKQILFDYEYRPMWKRPDERQPATRADPKEWFDWFSVFWLYDDSLHPEDSLHLTEILEMIVEEFVTGGPLLVRRWKPQYVWAGTLVSRSHIDAKTGLRVMNLD